MSPSSVLVKRKPGGLHPLRAQGMDMDAVHLSQLAKLDTHLTQNNTQKNTQNIYVTNNTHTATSGGGDSGGRGYDALPPFCPICGAPLVMTLVIMLGIVMAASYGLMTACNNTVSAIQYTLGSAISFMSWGYFADTQVPSPDEPIMNVTRILTPVILTPMAIVRSPSGVATAVGDLFFWTDRLMSNTDLKAHVSDTGFLDTWQGDFVDHHGTTLYQFWIITCEDSSRAERDLHRIFGPPYKEMSYLLAKLESFPATQQYHDRVQDWWGKTLHWLTWSHPPTPMQIIHENMDRMRSLLHKTKEAGPKVSAEVFKSLGKRINILVKATCVLRNDAERASSNLARDAKLGLEMAAVVSRGNIMCETFRQLSERVLAIRTCLEGWRDELNKMEYQLKALDETISEREELRSVGAIDLAELEALMKDFLETLAEPVKKLYVLDTVG
jgi:hypothetical protein